MPGLFIERQEAVGIFHAKWVNLMMSVYSLIIAREGAVIGIPSPELQKEKSLQIIKQKLLRSHNLYFIAWEPPLMCLAWKILITDGREVNEKGACLKISFTSVLKT